MLPNVIEEGAIFIADAHYSKKRTQLLLFIEHLLQDPPSQLFLLGDIFDFLIGDFSYLIEENYELIHAIDKLSTQSSCKVFFLEGNHDFRLNNVFSKVTPIPIQQQPYVFNNIALSHGDNASDLKHKVFTKIIRSSLGLGVIHLLTLNFLNNRFLKKVIQFLNEKNLCHSFNDFESFVEKRITNNYSEVGTIIEGHYHQGCKLSINSKLYLNLPSFACNESYIVVKFRQNELSFINKVFKG